MTGKKEVGQAGILCENGFWIRSKLYVTTPRDRSVRREPRTLDSIRFRFVEEDEDEDDAPADDDDGVSQLSVEWSWS